jgi:hypothetical protein
MRLIVLGVLVLLGLLVMLVMPVVAQETETTRVVPFEDMHIMSPLPDYVYAMPRPLFEKWCVLQNAGALRKAQRLQDVYLQRNPYRESYVQTADYKAGVTQSQVETSSPDKATFSGSQDTEYSGKNFQQSYREYNYAGGPVVVLNPYASRPAKVIYGEEGSYVADPDKTLTKAQAQKLLESEDVQ